MEQFAYQALYGIGMLLAGVGGSQWYGRRNGNGWNGKDRRDYITKSEIAPQLKSINSRLGENREDFKTVFRQIGEVKKEVGILGQAVARIQGAHER